MKRRRDTGLLVCATHLGAALLVLPGAIDVVRGTGATFSTVTLSLLHVVVLALGGVVGGAAALAGARRWPRFPDIALLAALVAALAVAGLLVERTIVASVLRSAVRVGPCSWARCRSRSILFESDGRLDLVGPQVWMTRFFFAVPLLLALLAARLIKTRFADPGRTFVLVWATVFFFLTILQRRFAETAAPAMALLGRRRPGLGRTLAAPRAGGAVRLRAACARWRAPSSPGWSWSRAGRTTRASSRRRTA